MATKKTEKEVMATVEETPVEAVAVETVKEEAAEKKPAAKKTTTRKTTAKKTTAKKAADDTAEETAKKPAAKKTTTRRTTKKAAANTEVYVQFWGKEVFAKELVEKIKKIWTDEMGREEKALTDLKVYIKPEENGAHYVFNGEITGFIGL